MIFKHRDQSNNPGCQSAQHEKYPIVRQQSLSPPGVGDSLGSWHEQDGIDDEQDHEGGKQAC